MSTMWPWSKHDRDIEEAHQKLEKAASEAAQAERRANEIEQLAVHSRQVSNRLRQQFEMNNFTELFIQSMGGRRR